MNIHNPMSILELKSNFKIFKRFANQANSFGPCLSKGWEFRLSDRLCPIWSLYFPPKFLKWENSYSFYSKLKSHIGEIVV